MDDYKISYFYFLSAYYLASNLKAPDEYGRYEEGDDKAYDDEDEHSKGKRHSHLLISFSQNSIKEVEMRSNSFFMDERTILYWPRVPSGKNG